MTRHFVWPILVQGIEESVSAFLAEERFPEEVPMIYCIGNGKLQEGNFLRLQNIKISCRRMFFQVVMDGQRHFRSDALNLGGDHFRRSLPESVH